MTPYRNLSGNSGVVSYESKEDSILVVFGSGRWRNYLYNHISPGKHIVDQMKALADQGRGLNTYIRECVGKNYADRS
jgi:hypothetical protein